jgi:2-dehydropantoate 2-reductase
MGILVDMQANGEFRYIIFGAGAVGSSIGGLMTQAGLEVAFIARPSYAEALKKGVRLEQDGDEITFTADYAVTSVRDLRPTPNDVVLITAKSQHTAEIAQDLAAVYDSTLRVVCLQNGIRNEAIVSERFKNVYAGLVFLSAVQMSPDLITLPKGRVLTIGCYPDGVDSTAERIVKDLVRGGLEATSSSYVMAMKWGKLIMNLNNATNAITGYWLERAMADSEMRRLMVAVREEGLRVLDAAGIPAEPPEGEASPIRVRELTEALRRPPKPESARQALEGHRTYPSMWQDLSLGRASTEVDFLNGEIMEVGRRVGVPTPYNAVLLEIVNRMLKEGLMPGLYNPSQLHALIEQQTK